jgi:hypothetical protein
MIANQELIENKPIDIANGNKKYSVHNWQLFRPTGFVSIAGTDIGKW